MPPVSFVEAQGVAELDATHFGGLTPTNARRGDVLLAIVGCFDARDLAANVAVADIVVGGIQYHVDHSKWTKLARLVQGNDVAMLLRHVVEDDDEPAHWAWQLTGASTHKLAGAMVLYRGIAPYTALVESGSAAVVASTVWNTPSRTLTTYSDMYIGLSYCRTAGVVITPAGHMTQRYHIENAGGGTDSSALIADYRQEAIGATGVGNGSTAANQTGIVASFALAANPAFKPEILTLDVPGGIGLWGDLRPFPASNDPNRRL